MFGEEFQAETIFCPLIGSELHVFDANGDGYDDLTCHTSNGTIAISESHIVEQRTGGLSGNQSGAVDAMNQTMSIDSIQSTRGGGMDQTTVTNVIENDEIGNHLSYSKLYDITLHYFYRNRMHGDFLMVYSYCNLLRS